MNNKKKDNKSEKEIEKYLLIKINAFYSQGYMVIRKYQKDEWKKEVDKALKSQGRSYNLGTIEAALECMKRLSQGLSIEESYIPIDIENFDKKPIYFNNILTPEQNQVATLLIVTYHERGDEFANYRNSIFDENRKRLL